MPCRCLFVPPPQQPLIIFIFHCNFSSFFTIKDTSIQALEVRLFQIVSHVCLELTTPPQEALIAGHVLPAQQVLNSQLILFYWRSSSPSHFFFFFTFFIVSFLFVSCPHVGKYNPSSAQTACLSCPDGSYSSATGQTSISTCSVCGAGNPLYIFSPYSYPRYLYPFSYISP